MCYLLRVNEAEIQVGIPSSVHARQKPASHKPEKHMVKACAIFILDKLCWDCVLHSQVAPLNTNYIVLFRSRYIYK